MKERLFTLVMTVVAAALVLSGCQTAPAETPPAETLPQPEFPLTEEAVNAALEQSGFPGEISAEETQSYQEGHIAYSLRDDSRTYTAGGNAVLQRRDLQFPGRWRALSGSHRAPAQPERAAGALPVGGHEAGAGDGRAALRRLHREEELYRAFSEEEFPQEQKVGQWTEPVTDWGQWTKDLTRRLLPGHCQTDPGAHRFHALHRDPYHPDLPVGGGLSGLPEGAGGGPAARDPAGPRVITIHNAINKPPGHPFFGCPAAIYV